MPTELRDFLMLPYGELEDLNLEAKQQRKDRVAIGKIQEGRLKYLTDERRIKAVTVLFSDLEGRLHMLDYDKKFLLKSADNLTFDGSSIRGFTPQRESDLRLALDWNSFYWGPADVFGPGKVLVFGDVLDRDGSPFAADIRGILKKFAKECYERDGYTLNAANEIEGFVFQGLDAERHYHERGRFDYVNTGGYYHSLPDDPLRMFIDTVAEVQRAMGFENEKDHPEVAPSQFEINYSYGEVVAAADTVQLYKLICRQVATKHGMSVSFLPKPIVGVNGNGMHTNVSVSKGGKNLFWDAAGEEKLSAFGWQFIDRTLTHGNDTCLMLNSSVNAYRRLDPHFEAPNQIKASAVARGSMAQHAGRSPRGRTRRQPVHGDAGGLQDRSSGRHQRRQEPASGRTLPTRQHLRCLDELPQRRMDDEAARRRRQGTVCRAQTGQRRPLSAPAGHLRESSRSPVPPRSVQPVSLEPVLAGVDARSPALLRRTPAARQRTNARGA